MKTTNAANVRPKEMQSLMDTLAVVWTHFPEMTFTQLITAIAEYKDPACHDDVKFAEMMLDWANKHYKARAVG